MGGLSKIYKLINKDMNTVYEENIKNFNRMFNDLDPDHFDRFTYLMAEAVVKKVELADELTKKLGAAKQNYGNRLRDVQIWCKERLYRYPLGATLSYPKGAALP